jgi:hypothetical protein
VEFSASSVAGEVRLVEVLLPSCRSVAIALVPSSGDVDLYVGWDTLVYPSGEGGFYAASYQQYSGPEYVMLCCGTYTAQPFMSGRPIYLNIQAATNSSWTLHVYDMSAPIPVEPLYLFGTPPPPPRFPLLACAWMDSDRNARNVRVCARAVNTVVECETDGACSTFDSYTMNQCTYVNPISPAPDSPLVSWASSAPEPYLTPPPPSLRFRFRSCEGVANECTVGCRGSSSRRCRASFR